MKIQLRKKDILFPVPSALVVSGAGVKANIITIAWVGIVGSNPPAIGISLHKSRYSLSLIRETNEFTVNIPRQVDFKKVDYCGIVSGRKVNKFEKTGFTPIPGCKVHVPIIKECPFNLECKVLSEMEISGWTLVIGEILEANIDRDCCDEHNQVLTDKIDPLVYIPTIREYWSMGAKLGDSFKAGKDIRS